MKTHAAAATAAVCASLLVLSGCLKPPPVSGPPRADRMTLAGAAPSAAAAGAGNVAGNIGANAAGNAAGNIIVAPGDTLHGIARRTGAPVAALIAANGLTPPYTLYPGQALVVNNAPAQPAHAVRTPPFGAENNGKRPSAATGAYIVAPGDTLFAVAKRLGVSFGELSRANGLENPWVIHAGQRLRVPGVWEPARPVEDQPPIAMAALPPPTASPEPAALESPASEPAATELAASKPAAPAAKPAPEPVAKAAPARAEAAPPRPARRPAVKPAVARAEPVPAPTPIPVAQRIARPGAEPQPAAARQSGSAQHAFLWPVEGPILSRFGPGEGVSRNDGINIAAETGAPVRAAANGVVVYAGNELRGYGNLLLIRHPGGWTSAYAHNAELMVARGAAVERGQVVARVGSTGGVSRPQSHFELRKGTEAVDPLKYLAAR